MMFDTHSNKNSAQGLVQPSEIYQIWKRSGLSKQKFAERLGLRNRSTLTQLINGSNQHIHISLRLSKRLKQFESNEHDAEIVSKIEIPPGTVLPDNAKIARCQYAKCSKNFISMNSRKQFHRRICQSRNWRQGKRGNP